jgi:hypothetical protein
MVANEKNTMMCLDDNGVVIEGTDKLIDHATSYYKNLFGPAPGNLFPINHSMWKPHEKMDDKDKEIISRPFTIEEVKDAMFSMKKRQSFWPRQYTY